MAPDIAEIVARLLTYQKKASRGGPTAGAASMRLMYFAYQDMFQEDLQDIRFKLNIIMA